jgi:hypothetical protein
MEVTLALLQVVEPGKLDAQIGLVGGSDKEKLLTLSQLTQTSLPTVDEMAPVQSVLAYR